jgi:hypothetical protein
MKCQGRPPQMVGARIEDRSGILSPALEISYLGGLMNAESRDSPSFCYWYPCLKSCKACMRVIGRENCMRQKLGGSIGKEYKCKGNQVEGVYLPCAGKRGRPAAGRAVVCGGVVILRLTRFSVTNQRRHRSTVVIGLAALFASFSTPLLKCPRTRTHSPPLLEPFQSPKTLLFRLEPYHHNVGLLWVTPQNLFLIYLDNH